MIKIDGLTLQGIRKDKSKGMKQSDIARKYRVSRSAVSRIVLGSRRVAR